MQLMVRPEALIMAMEKPRWEKSYITISKDYSYHGCIDKSVL